MKLDILVSLIDGEKRSRSSAKINLSSSASSGLLSQTATGEIDVDPDVDGPAYTVKLSGKEPSDTQKLSEQVRSENEDEALRRYSNGRLRENRRSSPSNAPSALTSLLQKPEEASFEEFFNRMVKDPSLLLLAHKEIDRGRALHLLLG